MKSIAQYCLIGHPVGHSLSPRIHNAAFRKQKIRARYTAVDVAPKDLKKFMKDFRRTYAGGNVTIPHKEKIIRFLDEVSAEAQAIGAVNTIVNKNGRLFGDNTDAFGARAALEKNGDLKGRLKGKKVVVLGAGGASRALVYAIKKAGGRVRIFNRTLSRAKKLAQEFHVNFAAIKNLADFPADILINTTSVGMWPHAKETPLANAAEIFRKKPIVMDIVYRPRLTRFLRDARRNGCRIITGDHMFKEQAERSREVWLR